MSAHRTNHFIKNVNRKKCFPKDVHLIQEMLNSADMTPKVDHTVPNMKPVRNIAKNHELFEVHWRDEDNQLKINRIRNLLNK